MAMLIRGGYISNGGPDQFPYAFPFAVAAGFKLLFWSFDHSAEAKRNLEVLKNTPKDQVIVVGEKIQTAMTVGEYIKQEQRALQGVPRSISLGLDIALAATSLLLIAGQVKRYLYKRKTRSTLSPNF